MLDVDDEIREELERLAPPEDEARRDWDDVRRRSGLARRRSRRRIAALAAALAVVIAVPSLALSSNIRELLGFEHPAVLEEAQLMVEAPAQKGMVARVYESPSRLGGKCLFSVIVPAGSPERPARHGGGSCQVGADSGPLHFGEQLPIQLGMSGRPKTPDNVAGWQPPLLNGWVYPRLGAARVMLEWTGGSMELAYANDYFVVVSEVLYEPPRERLPFWVVAYDAEGGEVGRKKVPKDWLYWE